MKQIIFLFCLLPFLGSAQTINLRPVADPAPATITITGAYSTFTATAGNNSASQSVTVGGSNLSANVTFTVTDSTMQISTDNATWGLTVSYTQSGGSISGSLYARTRSTVAQGSYSGVITGTSTGASPVNVPYSATIASATQLTVTGTMSNFTSTSGTPSAAQTVTVSGTSLTANCIVTWPTGFECSLDGTNYAGTQTIVQSGGTLSGQPVTVYTRVAASATAGSYNTNVQFASTGASTVNAPVTATVTNPLAAIFNFSSASSTVAGATNFFGNPTGSLSFTDAGTGWTLINIPASWSTYGGFFGGVGNGATAASSGGTFTQAQINSNMYNSQAWNSATPNYGLEFSNLPAGTYNITLLGSIPTGTFANGGYMAFHVQFGTGSDNVSDFDPNGGSGVTTGNLTESGPGTTNVQTGTFTGTITAGQFIKISLNSFAGPSGTGTLGYINAVKIVKTN